MHDFMFVGLAPGSSRVEYRYTASELNAGGRFVKPTAKRSREVLTQKKLSSYAVRINIVF